MRRKTKRNLLVVGLALGILWNCLCVMGLLPIGRWRFSLTIVGFALLFTLIPLMLPSVFQQDEKSEDHAQQKPGTRLFAGASVGLLALWGVSLIVCIAIS